MSEEYLNKGMDLKRLMLFFQKKIWLVIMLAILGGTLGGVIYQVVRAVSMPIEYEAVSKLYISFGHDESGEVYQYYNGYTWNDLIGADPILDQIMTGLPGYEKNQVRDAIKAEILSDIRLLTVTVNGENEKFVREIREAVETGLNQYAKESDELKQIKVIRSTPPTRVYWDDQTTQACVLGAVLLGVISFICLLFMYAFDESVYVQSDIEKMYHTKALGLLTRNQKGLQPYARELKGNIRYIMGDKRTVAVLDMGNHCETRQMELEKLLNGVDPDLIGGDIESKEWKVTAFNENVMSEEEITKAKELGGMILILPFGTDTGRKTQRMLSLLFNQDCPVLGMVIGQADEEFLNRYYA